MVPWSPVTSFFFQLTLPILFGVLYVLSFLALELWRSWYAGHPHVRYKRMLRQTLKYLVSFVLMVRNAILP